MSYPFSRLRVLHRFFEDLNFHCFLTEQALQLFYLFVVVNKNWSQFHFFSSIYFPIRSAVIHRYIHEAGVHLIFNYILCYCMDTFVKAKVTSHWCPLVLQTSEETYH